MIKIFIIFVYEKKSPTDLENEFSLTPIKKLDCQICVVGKVYCLGF